MEFALAFLLKYKYLVLLPLAMAEGPLVALIAGFLGHVGILDIPAAYVLLVLGDVLPDAFFYAMGYFSDRSAWVRRYVARSSFFATHFPLVRRLWERHGLKTMLCGKLAYGMGLPFLMSAGMTKMSYVRFLGYALPISLVQCGTIMAAGYWLGRSYRSAAAYIDWAYLIIAAMVVALVALYFLLKGYARKKIDAMEHEVDSDS